MNLIIKRLFLAGTLALPAACATYPQQYYGSRTSYYYPGYYDSGYGVIERNYHSTYPYPTAVYRTETHHYDYDDNDHYDDYSHRDPHRPYLDTRRHSMPLEAPYRRHDSRQHRTNPHHNWIAQSPNHYDNRMNEWGRQHHHDLNQGQHPPPNESNAHGKWHRRQN